MLYECIHTMTLALPFTRKADGTESKAVPAAVRLCSEHLRKFTEDPDQNLKYLVSALCFASICFDFPSICSALLGSGFP